MTIRNQLLAALTALLGAAYAHGAISFMGLGVESWADSSSAIAVSADGTTVVGNNVNYSTHVRQAFRWKVGGGMSSLGSVPGSSSYENSSAYGVSGDGTTVVGDGYGYSTLSSFETFRWTVGEGMVGLGYLSGSFSSSAGDISNDGTTVVGTNSGHGFAAFRWTANEGLVGLGDLPGGEAASGAIAVSGNGTVVVGTSGSSSGSEAYRWTAAGGMVGLGDLPGDPFYSFAYDVSDDGATVVGAGDISYSTPHQEAFRWTANEGMVGLGDLPGGSINSYAHSVSGDGTIIVGRGFGFGGYEAFIWDGINGMRPLRDVLVAGGANVSGWRLSAAYGISTDGRVIVGSGFNDNAGGREEAWRVDLGPAEPAPGGDFDGDDDVDGVDLEYWMTSFSVGDGADADNDGDSDGADFLTWQRELGMSSAVPTADAVPEPAAWLLCGISLPMLLRRRFR
jgi:probable HAF family extracellular repeat protein